MKKLVVIAIVLSVPAMAFADPDHPTGLGTVTAKFAGGNPDPNIKAVVTGNGKVVVTGHGKVTASTAKND